MNIPIEVIVNNLVGLFLLIGVGYLMVKIKLLPGELTGPLSAFLLNVTLPATIFAAMLREFDQAFLIEGTIIAVLGFVIFAGAAGLAIPLAKICRVPASQRGTWMMSVTFPNNGFMGFPLILALLGPVAMGLAVMFGIGFNILLYSVGIKQILADKKGDASVDSPSLFKILFTVVNLATVAGVAVFCLQIPIPECIKSPIEYLSGITTPLSMIVVGMNIAKGRIREVFVDKEAMKAVCVRLLVYPILVWGLFRCIPFDREMMKSVIIITLAMPSAGAGCILAERYGGDVDLAAHVTFLTSLLCIITIPVVCLLP